MKKFNYLSMDDRGVTKKGYYECLNKNQLIKYLYGKNQFLVSCREEKKILLFSIGRRLKNKDLSIFCRQISSMLQVGIPIIDILRMISFHKGKGSMLENVNAIIVSLEKGCSLYESMSDCPYRFPAFLLRMVKAGEDAGDLEKVFNNLSLHYYKDSKLKGKIKGAAAYPIFVLSFTLCAATILMTTVVPSMMDMIISSGGELPMLTKVVMSVSIFMENNLQYMTVFLLTLLCGAAYLKAKKVLNMGIILRRIPLLKKLYHKFKAYEILSVLHLLLNGGCSVVEALENVSEVTKDAYSAKQIKQAAKFIKEGGNIAKAFMSIDSIDYYCLSVIKLGEETGRLEEMIGRILPILEDEFSETLNKSSELIQPVSILLVGAVVGVIVLSVAMPMFSMYNM